MLFEVGRIYTRHQIHVALGGELQTYLPQHGGKIVCGCFQPDLDPEAPHEILVADTPKVRQKAEMLCQQGGSIPVFLKVNRNRWEYRGLFQVKKLSLDPLEIIHKAQKLGRNYIAAVLYLECASMSDDIVPRIHPGRKKHGSSIPSLSNSYTMDQYLSTFCNHA